MEKVATLLTFGFVVIVQTIVTGELGYLPTDILVKFGLVVGVGMMLGSGYALVVPAMNLGAAFRAAAPASARSPSTA